MNLKFEDKTNSLKTFFSGTTAFLSIVAMLFSAFTVKAQTQAEYSDKLMSPGTVFTNSAPITVTDRVNNNAGTDPGLANLYPSPITVANLNGTVTKVTVTFAITSTFPDDLDILLVGPTGAQSLVISDAGGSGDLANASFTFDQTAATAFPDTGTTPIPTGTYQPANYTGLATPEPGGFDNFPQVNGLASYPTTFNIFNGTNPNGVWKLYVVDDQAVDTSSLPNGWSIDITTAATGCPTAKAPLDYNGDGKTDFVVVRNTGGGSGGAITWYVGNSNNTPILSATAWGISTDYFISGDFDGDNKADVTVWRSGTQASPQSYFYILQSQTNTFRADTFGQIGDDPTVVGDYTGDGKTDPAVYRDGAATGNPSFWYYRASSGPFAGQVVGTQWGQNGDFPAPGDYDGDGKYDFVVQRNAGGGAANFFLNQTTAGIAGVQFGTPNDNIVPGDYDGDCKTDIAVARSSGGALNWYIRRSTDGALMARTFGASATDFFTQGDYDGDGVTDISVWRQSPTPSLNSFYWLTSVGNVVGARQWGQQFDFPVANFNRH